MFTSRISYCISKSYQTRRFCDKLPTAGQVAQITRRFTEKDVDDFGRLTGDLNPVHFDDAAARRAGFDGRLVHGALINGVISNILGTVLPGPGSILVKQVLNYKKPVYIGDEVLIKATVQSVNRSLVNCQYVCSVPVREQVVVTGEALIFLKRI
ncbi:Hydroxyacyl-thioester dehydratase type 2, mitochondrial [Halotydeus destructor]|nr:Hydroxyacyl-thioester dehydratase type 2, mitochondrial [Halotydeus destructor]